MSSAMPYIMGGGELLGGAVASYFGGPQIGVPLMMNGASTLAGGASGNSSGSGMGGLGGLSGSMIPGLPGLGGGSSASSTTPTMAPPFSSNPGGGAALPAAISSGGFSSPSPGAGTSPTLPPYSGLINPAAVGTPISSQQPTTPQAVGGTNPQPNPYQQLGMGSNSSAVGNAYLQYIMQKNLVSQQQKTAYAPTHSSTVVSPSPFGSTLLPQQTFAMPQI